MNLTPHEFTLYTSDTVVLRVPPSGEVFRLAEIRTEADHLNVDGTHVPVIQLTHATDTAALPARQPGVLLLVSRVSAQAVSDRDDVVFPLDEVRDEANRIVGCHALGRFVSSPEGKL